MCIKKALQVIIATFSLSLSPVAISEIRIGIAGPHSGAYAAFGEQLWRGASQAAEDINAEGGILGEFIELIKADDACEPKQAVAVANRITDHEEVMAVVGHFCSSSTIPASNIYADADIIMITPASTNPTVTDRGLPTIFRTCGRDDQQGIVAADYIHHTLQAKRIAVVHDKDTYGKGLADAMVEQLATYNITPTLYEGLTRGEKDFNALVTKFKQIKVDAVYFGGLHTEAGPLVRQMREQQLVAPFISGDGIVSEDFLVAAGGAKMVNNVYMTFGADPRHKPEGAAVVARFRDDGFEPEGYTLYSYATLQAVAAAANATGTTDGQVLATWLKDNTVPTIMGAKDWDNKGDLVSSDYVMYRWDTAGKYAQVN